MPNSNFNVTLNKTSQNLEISGQSFNNSNSSIISGTINISQASISNNSNVNIIAEKSITSISEFEISFGNEVHMYLTDLTEDCQEYPQSNFSRISLEQNPFNKYKPTSKPKIELAFIKDDISLSPNPTTSEFKILYNKTISSKSRITIYDSNGNLISEIFEYLSQTPIDVSNLCKGLYFVKIIDKESTHIKQLVIF